MVYNKVNEMATKHMTPADMIQALQDDDAIDNHMIPKSSQISSRKRSLKNDTSDGSYYRLQTFFEMTKHLEELIPESLESYKHLGFYIMLCNIIYYSIMFTDLMNAI